MSRSTMIRAGRRALTVASIAGLLVVGAVAVATAPDPESISDPFMVQGSVGQTLVTRTSIARVDGVRLASELDASYAFEPPDTTTDGIWVIADATITARQEDQSMSYVEMVIGDTTYRSSTILPAPSLSVIQYNPGVPVSGSFVFEIPASAIDSPDAADAQIVLKTLFAPVLDTIPVVHVDLTGLTVLSDAPIIRPIVQDQK